MKKRAIEHLIPLFEDRHKYLSKNNFFYTERHLQCIWADPAIRPTKLYSINDEEITVLNPGEWNGGAGPDFLNATLMVGKNKKILTGDIEIHISSEDWIRHNHSSDSRYQNVIAHITYFYGKLPNGKLPENAIEISLQKALEEQPSFSFDSIDIFAIPELPRAKNPACQEILKEVSNENIQELLNEIGKARIAIKTERMKKLIQKDGSDQLFYEEIMAALGFKNNSAQMRKLARLLPLRILKEESENDPIKAYAILLGVAGLLPSQPSRSFDSQSKMLIRNLWDHWWRKNSIWLDNAMKKDEWCLCGIRPQNHPQRRLLAIPQFFIAQEKPLIEKFYAIFANRNMEPSSMIKQSISLLSIESPDYWRQHILIGSTHKKNAGKLIGKGRASAILTNIVIPFLAAIGCSSVVKDEILCALPAEDDNIIVRRAARNLFGRDHNPHVLYNNALRQQGLIQIYYDFCMIDKTMCNSCPFAEALKTK